MSAIDSPFHFVIVRIDRTKAWRRIASPDLDLQVTESELKKLIGRYNGPNQGESPGAVAFYKMSRSDFFEGWLCCRANLLGILAARVEVTAGWWIGGIGNFTSKEDALLPGTRVRE